MNNPNTNIDINTNISINTNNTNNNTVPRIANNPTGSSSSSTTQACAACKYQRRKCAPDCVLAPYFPHDRQRQFLNAHKLFGVRKITKIIENLEPPHKDAAMRTIIFQSDARAHDPVGGCSRIVSELEYQIECTKAELECVLHQISVYRARQSQEMITGPEVSNVKGDFSDSCYYNNSSITCDYLQMQQPSEEEQEQYVVNNQQQHDLNHMQDDNSINAWAVVEVPCERNEMKFETNDSVERKLHTQLRIS